MRTPALKPKTIVGLDLSLRAAAVAVLPLHDGQWWQPGDRVHTHVVGESLPKSASELDRAQRLVEIVDGVLGFVQRFVELRPQRVCIAVEAYAYGAPGASHVQLAELGGAMRCELARSGIALAPIVASRARAYLGVEKRPAGKLSKDWMKGAVQRALVCCGYVFPTHDEADAFVVANAYAAEIGLCGVSVAIGSGGKHADS